MTEDTTQKAITLEDIFAELVKINKRLEAHDLQFEAIREGILHNASRFDRMDANIYNLRADISNLKADLRDIRSGNQEAQLRA